MVADPQRHFKSSVGGLRGDWQSDAWDKYDAVGELRYYVGWRASSCSRVRLVPSDIDPETGLPTGVTENEQFVDIVRSIAGGPLGQAQLIRRAVEGLTVPGELWVAILVGLDVGGGDLWVVLSRDEVRTTPRGGVVVELPDGDSRELDLRRDSIFRVWNPRARRAREADSPVRAALDPLREIVRTTKTISNASKSRLIGNGIVFVPQEMSLPSGKSPAGSNGAGSGDGVKDAPAVQQLQELLFQVAQTAYDDEDSMAALIPMFAGVPGEQVKNVSHLKFDNSVTEVAIKTRNDAISRLAMGLDVSPERLLGLGNNSNHWTAWQLGDDDVRLHIAPPIETICHAIYSQVLRVVLEREGIDPDQHMLWYDASELTADPDKGEEATSAFDRGAITAEAYRDYLGLGATGYDFTGIAGWQEWARDRVSQKPELLPQLLPLLDRINGLDFPQGGQPAVEAPAGGAPAPVEDGEQEPDTEAESEEGGRSVSAAAAAEDAVVELLVGRALELAGKRRRTRADHHRLRLVPMHETHRYMPAAEEPEVARLIRGWDDALRDSSLWSAGIDPDRVRAAVCRLARRELTSPMVEGS